MQRAFSIVSGLARPRAFALAATRSPLASAFVGRSFSASALSRAEEYKIFVGGLPHEAEETDLHGAFEKYGSVNDAFVARDPAGRSKKFGFVSFSDRRTLDSVLTESTHEILGQIVTVDESRPRIDRPERGPSQRVKREPIDAPPSGRIYLGNLPFDMGESEISEALAQFDTAGGLQSIRIPIGHSVDAENDTRLNKGFAFADMGNVEAATTLIENLKAAVEKEDYRWPAPNGKTFTPTVAYAQAQAPRRNTGYDSSRSYDRRSPSNDRRDQTRFDRRGKREGRSWNRDSDDSY